jgi:FkbM family methyltransferase
MNGVRFRLCKSELIIPREIWEWNCYHYQPRAGDVVLDLGAHKGVFTVYAALGGATVHAYEPCADSYRMLLENCARNEVLPRVHAHNMAVWSKHGTLPLHHWPEAASGDSLIKAEHSGFELVNCITLAEAMHGIERCHFLKVDVEGAEFEVLSHAWADVFTRVDAVAVEIHSMALDPGGREHPVKFPGYTDEKFRHLRDHMGLCFDVDLDIDKNGDPHYLYGKRRGM